MWRPLWNIIRHPIRSVRWLLADALEVKAAEYYKSAKNMEWLPDNSLLYSLAKKDKAMGDLFIALSKAIRGGK